MEDFDDAIAGDTPPSSILPSIVEMESIPFASGNESCFTSYKGDQGDVYRGVLIENGKKVTVKVIPLQRKITRGDQEVHVVIDEKAVSLRFLLSFVEKTVFRTLFEPSLIIEGDRGN